MTKRVSRESHTPGTVPDAKRRLAHEAPDAASLHGAQDVPGSFGQDARRLEELFVPERTEDYLLRLHSRFNRRIVEHIAPHDLQSRMFDAKGRWIANKRRYYVSPLQCLRDELASRSARCSHDQDSSGILVRHGMSAGDGRAESPAGEAE